MDIPKVVQSYFNPCDRWSKAENKTQRFLVIVQVASYFFIIIPLFVATVGLGAWSFSKLFKETPASSNSNTEDKDLETDFKLQVTLQIAEEYMKTAANILNPANCSSMKADSLFKFKSAWFFYADYNDDVITIQDIQYAFKQSMEWIVNGQKIPKKDRAHWLLPLLHTCTHRDWSNFTHNTLIEIAKLLPPLKKSSSPRDINLYISIIKILNQYTFSDFNFTTLSDTFKVIDKMIQKIDLGKNKNQALCQQLDNDISTLKASMVLYLESARQRYS